MFGKLHQELQDAYDEEKQVLHHPHLVKSLYHPFDENEINRINANFVHAQRASFDALRQQKYAQYLNIIQRPYRLEAFVDGVEVMVKDRQYWKLLSSMWLDTEYPYANYSEWLRLFGSKRTLRPLLMNKAERATLTALPDVLTIYRGGQTKRGLSWTVSEDKARWFAERFDRDGKHQVFKGTVPKNKVYAYLNERKEQEIVVDPKFVIVE